MVLSTLCHTTATRGCPRTAPEASSTTVYSCRFPSSGSSGKLLPLRVWPTGCDDGSGWDLSSNPVGDARSGPGRRRCSAPSCSPRLSRERMTPPQEVIELQDSEIRDPVRRAVHKPLRDELGAKRCHTPGIRAKHCGDVARPVWTTTQAGHRGDITTLGCGCPTDADTEEALVQPCLNADSGSFNVTQHDGRPAACRTSRPAGPGRGIHATGRATRMLSWAQSGVQRNRAARPWTGARGRHLGALTRAQAAVRLPCRSPSINAGIAPVQGLGGLMTSSSSAAPSCRGPGASPARRPGAGRGRRAHRRPRPPPLRS